MIDIFVFLFSGRVIMTRKQKQKDIFLAEDLHDLVRAILTILYLFNYRTFFSKQLGINRTCMCMDLL